jgi:hypothetical protein
MRYRLLGCLIALGALAPAACSSADEAPGSGIGGSAATGGGGLGGGTGGSGALVVDAGADADDPDAGCGLIQEQAKTTPLHLYVMMDKSSSMFGSKWDAAKAGLEAFVNDPASLGIYVGLGFFPRPADGTPLCDQGAYKTPKVGFDLLPANAGPIVQALAAEQPDGLSTPIYPALGGAILAGIEIASNNPGHTAAVLLVTDGEPQGPAPLCSGVNPEDFQEIAELASKGAASKPPVLTYVIGLPGVNQSFANTVAEAGGTTSAILVSSANVKAEFQQALSKVRGQALPCELEIPDEVKQGEIAFDKVNVILGSGGKEEKLPQTTDCAALAGWYYVPPATSGDDPTKIVLCPSVCDGIKNDFSAKIEILLGCETYKPT